MFKVAWVRVDTQTILTIHHNIITRNQRVSLSHHDHKQWQLHLNNVQESDRGWYMCQINTDPMRSERGYLEVVGKLDKITTLSKLGFYVIIWWTIIKYCLYSVPPTIIDSRTSPDIVVKEGSSVNFTCEAIGAPEPKIRWKREDNKHIMYDAGKGNSFVLQIWKILFGL